MNFCMEEYGVYINNIPEEKMKNVPDLVYGVKKENSIVYYYDRCGGVCPAAELAAITLSYLLAE